jgi:5'-nucleotidase
MYSFKKASGNPGWITDTKTNCKLYTHDFSKNRYFTWDGLCENNLAQGSGELTVFWNNKEFYHYKGSVEQGKVSGFGVLRMADDGDTYEGEFENGLLHGDAHFYSDDGDHYLGEWVAGKKEGMGTYWYDPSSPIFKYTGEWVNDQQDGSGTLYYRNGKEVKGVFQEGKLVEQVQNVPSQSSIQKKNILITNDDGVEDMDRLICLAEALSPYADKIVIATSAENRSGTSNTVDLVKTGKVSVEQLDYRTSENISIFKVEGYPADCVLFGTMGIFGSEGLNVDLVISGINGGANEGASWFGSGTIGAARTAALMGIPAIAVSGIDEEVNNPLDRDKICQWVAEFSISPTLERMKKHEYLTISIPDNLDEIKGVKVVERAITFDRAPFFLEPLDLENSASQKETTWVLKPNDPSQAYKMPANNDVFYYYQGYIVVVPMSVNENQPSRLMTYKNFESTQSPFE